MEYLYKPGDLEKYVSDIYKKKGIFHPCQLDEECIAGKFGIHIVYSVASFSDYSDDFSIIGLHRNLRFDSIKRREVFFHELGHILLHAGDQTKMTDSFRYFQESQTKRFTMFAAIPYHMLQYIDLSQRRDYILYEMQEIFRIPVAVCRARLDYIENKLLNYEGKIYA